ncbi:MAG: hypothetical protein AAF322_00135 [Pseudomonadota bacterium]
MIRTIASRLRAAAVCVVALAAFALPAGQAIPQDRTPELTQAEAETAARSVARFCKILIDRMDELIDDQWATQDLGDLASVWNSLACHEVFGVDERVRWLVR